jgi:DNA mismatch endonuclease (patch repair protein)
VTDFVSKEKRSRIMASIKSENTSIERKLAEYLTRAGIGFQKHPKLPGRPDFLIEDSKLLVYCDGDFWHGYDYKKRRHKLPKFWRKKIETNMKRDNRIRAKLRRSGWKVIRLWEHEINKSPEKYIDKIARHSQPRETP